ncbi:type II secretion system protein [Mucisphaera sp.]|uniref:type II secretion system protein n=1 Tax=Mucisphaera sp. TaxID=2913024 RepID=UPI003D103ED5
MKHAFTLVEILIVVVILGILAAVVIPQFSDAATEAKVAASAANVRAISGRIAVYHAEHGAFPPTIQDEWFVGSVDSPIGDSLADAVGVDASNNSDKWHTIAKGVPEEGIPESWGGIYWYNALNGAFRARVPEQATEQATIDLYNRVNNTSVTSLRQITP